MVPATSPPILEVLLTGTLTVGNATAGDLNILLLAPDRNKHGRLFYRRVDDLPLSYAEYLCYSPFYQRRSGQPLSLEPYIPANCTMARDRHLKSK